MTGFSLREAERVSYFTQHRASVQCPHCGEWLNSVLDWGTRKEARADVADVARSHKCQLEPPSFGFERTDKSFSEMLLESSQAVRRKELA